MAVTVTSIAPLSPSSRKMSTVPGVFIPAIHTFCPEKLQVAASNSPCVHATGRWLKYAIGVYQATHSSSPHARNFASVALWIPGVPLLSAQRSASAWIFVTPPLGSATTTSPVKLTDVREGLPAASGRVT